MNLESDLRRLVSTRILDCEDRRYRLADDLRTFLPASAVLDETKRRYVSSIAREIRNHRTDQERLRDEVLLIVEIVEWGVGLELFEEIFLLVQGVEWIFIIDGLWEAWLRILRSVVYGAKAAGNKAVLAWALHECGTRALCLGEVKSASDFLNQAYRARTELGDVEGASVSLQNLKHLYPQTAVPPRRPALPKVSRAVITLGVGFVIVLGILIFRPWIKESRDDLMQPTPAPSEPAPRDNAAEILEFRAAPSVITPGEQVVLTFGLKNAQAARIEPEVGALSSLADGTVSVSPREPTAYSLVATGSDGKTIRKTVFINVKRTSPAPRDNAAEILEFRAAPSVITPREQVVLTFGLKNPQAARIEPEVGALSSLADGTVSDRQGKHRTMNASLWTSSHHQLLFQYTDHT